MCLLWNTYKCLRRTLILLVHFSLALTTLIVWHEEYKWTVQKTHPDFTFLPLPYCALLVGGYKCRAVTSEKGCILVHLNGSKYPEAPPPWHCHVSIIHLQLALKNNTARICFLDDTHFAWCIILHAQRVCYAVLWANIHWSYLQVFHCTHLWLIFGLWALRWQKDPFQCVLCMICGGLSVRMFNIRNYKTVFD
jgi:hypothetical protein